MLKENSAILRIFDLIGVLFVYYAFLVPPIIFFISLFFVSYGLSDFFIWLVFHYIMATGQAVCYHRYFSHKSFEVNRFVQFLMGFWGTLSSQRGPLWWASVHRSHHRHCGTKDDPHSPSKGFIHSHMGWYVVRENTKIQWNNIQDLAKYPELRVLEKLYFINFPLISFVLYWFGGMSAMISYHMAVWTSVNGSAAINSICHERDEVHCEALNLPWLALFNAGEGLHANHHNHPGSASCSNKWNQIDISYLVIKFLKCIRVIKRVRTKKNGPQIAPNE